MFHKKVNDTTADNEESSTAGLVFQPNDRPTDLSLENFNQEIKKSNKKWWYFGILAVVFIAALTVTLIFVFKKDQPVPDPVDPTIYYNPYVVYESDLFSNTFKLGITPKLRQSFNFPFKDSVNNKLFSNITLIGRDNFKSRQIIRFTFTGDEDSKTAIQENESAHVNDSIKSNPSLLNLGVDTTNNQFSMNITRKETYDQPERLLLSTVNQSLIMMTHY